MVATPPSHVTWVGRAAVSVALVTDVTMTREDVRLELDTLSLLVTFKVVAVDIRIVGRTLVQDGTRWVGPRGRVLKTNRTEVKIKYVSYQAILIGFPPLW